MALSRADFVGLADSIGLELKHEDDKFVRAGMLKVAHAICVDLKKSNRSFDKERFIDHIHDVAYHGKSITS